MRLLPYALTTAGILALAGSIGMGIVTSETVQTTGYAFLRGIGDGFKAAMPAWLVEKGDLDAPVPLLTDGPVVQAILKATLNAKEVEGKARPQVEAVERLERMAADLGARLAQYSTATAIGLQTIQATPPYKTAIATLVSVIAAANLSRMHPFTPVYDIFGPTRSEVLKWRSGNDTLYREALSNHSRLLAGEPHALVVIFGVWRPEWIRLENEFSNASLAGRMGVNATVSSAGLSLEISEEAIEVDFNRIDLAFRLSRGIPVPLAQYMTNYYKVDFALRPRVEAVLSALDSEKRLAAYKHYRELQEGRATTYERLLGALASTVRTCAETVANPDCRAIGAVEPHMENFLLDLGAWGFEIPEEILGIVLRAQGRANEATMTRRGLLRRLDIELVRKAPSKWAMMITVGVCLGIMTFVIGFAYNVAFILNMGLLGTVANLLGIVHVKTLGMRCRAELVEAHKTEMLRLEHARERVPEALRLETTSE